MTKHTPGPWCITSQREEYDEEGNEVGLGAVQRIEGPNGEHICGTCDGCNDITPENGRLIIAAPDMHALLGDFIDAWGSGAKLSGPRFEKLAERAAAILAQVAGE